jgi:phage gp29-like protein
MNELKNTTAVDTNEIASIKRDPLHPLLSGLIQPNDETLATRGQSKGIKLYEEIERDAQVFSCLNKRKMAVISRPWEVVAASDAALDQQAAEVVRTQLTALNFDVLCLNLLDAINKGYSIGEVIWANEGSAIIASEVRARAQQRFWFGEDYELRLKTLSNLLPGEQMPERKFIVHSVGAKDGSPYGLGLGSKLFWLVWFKRQGITFWLTFLDKFGSPTVIGKYPTGTQPPEQQKLMDALGAISQDAGVSIPAGMEIALLEATRGGQAGYELLCRYMDEQIAHCILGEAEGGKNSGGALASAAITRNEVRLELVQFDADMLSATLNKTLVKWITEFNVPGATPPTIWRKIVTPEDIKLRAERDQILFNMGMRPSPAYQAENYHGWTFPTKTEGKSLAFAESAPAVTHSDVLAAQLAVEAAPHWDAMLVQLRSMVQNAASLKSLRDDLLASFGDLPSDELVNVMAAGFALAELKGISDVADKSYAG